MELMKVRPNPLEDALFGGGRDEGLEPGKPFEVVGFPGFPLETGGVGSDSPRFASSIPRLLLMSPRNVITIISA